jgi:hypothetical protein
LVSGRGQTVIASSLRLLDAPEVECDVAGAIARVNPIEYVSSAWWKSRCFLLNLWRAVRGRPPSLTCWLERNPSVAGSIKWQFRYTTSAYDIPETDKRAWPAWSAQERQELIDAFEAAWQWLYGQAAPFANLNELLQYPPVNQSDTTNPNGAPWTSVTPAYARDLYLRWVGLNLAVEIGGHVPWSVTTYTSEELQILFDSASFLDLGGPGTYSVCSGYSEHANYVNRKDNLGSSLIAPPRYTLAFLRNANLVAGARADTVARLLDWARDNLVHFYGSESYATMEQHWQYRGLPPITRLTTGTSSTYPGATTANTHWTAGCHGTTGFLRNVLRAVNIPVQIIRVCGHSQAHFLTEGTYLDHADGLYDSNFKATGRPASDLLIDEATYTAWFGTSQVNHDTNCANLDRRVRELTTP